MISLKGGATFPFEVRTNESGQQYLDWGEKHKLYFALQKMNLRDPDVVEKVRKACSSKPEENKKDKSDKKSKKK